MILAIRIAGVALMTFLFVRMFGLPWGLLWGCSVAMIFLP
jgi:hypothetical protein